MNPNAVVLTQDQFNDLKESIRNEILDQLKDRRCPSPEDRRVAGACWREAKELINQRFTRKDLGHAHNPTAVAAFSQMIRDAFKVDRWSELTGEQGEKSLLMVKELLEVVEKYTIKKEGDPTNE